METTPAPKSRKTPLLPANDQQLAALAVFAAQRWQAESWLTLRHSTAAQFLQQAQAYETAVSSRQQLGAARPIDADELLNLDAQIDETLYRVKNRLVDKYGKKSAVAHYPTVGITKYNGAYVLDRDRIRRAAALQTLVKGLSTEKITDGDYGLSFWQPIAERYQQLVGQLTDTSGAVSKAVSHKDTMRDTVETVLSSLAKVLDGNYPGKQDYKAQLRAWGFQK
ncbi:hypothetical protein EJV47_11965 [Hymenobacter gummosus]|uniref:Uncharacterized protein n=1 Tax=Hymenobacter gummosus TaxID=1776032 RepID=A0A3S0JDW2_9BACT|nr:hypothetical protein [Hymenobacter gummosus]RTQ49536.1 hypothetical protein EJV47_11965 [Hymenobacter gummosus]